MKKVMIALFFMIMVGMVLAEPVPKYQGVVVRGASTYTLTSEDTTLVNQVPDPADPGTFVEVRFKVENIGGEHASDVVIELQPEFPFSIYPGYTTTRRVGDLHMQQTGDESYILYYKLLVDKNAISGNNPVKLRYSTDRGTTWTSKTFYIRIQQREATLSVDNVIVEPSQISPGQASKITLQLHNQADTLLRDVQVTLGIVTDKVTSASVTTSELPIAPVGSTNRKTIEYIEGNGVANVSFLVVAEGSAVADIYKLPIILSYSDTLGKNYSTTQYTSIIVGETPDIAVSVDDAAPITPNTAASLTVKFTNKGTSDVKLVYATIIDTDDFDVLSSEGVYVGNIDSDDYESATYSIIVGSSRESTVQIPFRVEYRDPNNRPFTKEMILTARVTPSFNIGKLFQQLISALFMIGVVVAIVLVMIKLTRK